jgi:hypothetical protein
VRHREPYVRPHVHRWSIVPDKFNLLVFVKRTCRDCGVTQRAEMDWSAAGAHSKELWPWLDLQWTTV